MQFLYFENWGNKRFLYGLEKAIAPAKRQYLKRFISNLIIVILQFHKNLKISTFKFCLEIDGNLTESQNI
jgi:hypothetical protein